VKESKFSIDFVGLGAKKAGTTWLYTCLKQHPEVCFPRKKELFFFNEYDTNFPTVKNGKYELGLEWYESQFVDCSEGKIKGEISPTYLYCKFAARRIKKHIPKVKLIVTLRDPIARALSQYIDHKKTGITRNISFEKAINEDPTLIDRGLYYKHLSYYFSLFPKENILVLFLEDMKINPKKELFKIYRFLNLRDRDFIPRNYKSVPNPSTEAIFQPLNYLLMHIEYGLKRYGLHFIVNFLDRTGIRRLIVSVKNLNSLPLKKNPEIRKKTIDDLRDIFRDDVIGLEKFLGKNLTSWKEPK